MRPSEEILRILEDITQQHPQRADQMELIEYVLKEDIDVQLRIDRIRNILSEIQTDDLMLQMQIFSITDLLEQLSDTEREPAQPGS